MYLAQVKGELLKSTCIYLIAQRQQDRTWATVLPSAEKILPLPKQYRHLGKELLVMVTLNDKREITTLSPALPEIVKVLNDWSMRILKHNANEAQIREWRDSIQLQTVELNKLKQQLHNDRTAFELQKASYITALESMRERVQALQVQVDFLEKAV